MWCSSFDRQYYGLAGTRGGHERKLSLVKEKKLSFLWKERKARYFSLGKMKAKKGKIFQDLKRKRKFFFFRRKVNERCWKFFFTEKWKKTFKLERKITFTFFHFFHSAKFFHSTYFHIMSIRNQPKIDVSLCIIIMM